MFTLDDNVRGVIAIGVYLLYMRGYIFMCCIVFNWNSTILITIACQPVWFLTGFAGAGKRFNN